MTDALPTIVGENVIFSVVANEGFVEFYVGNTLKGVLIPSSVDITLYENSYPYSISLVNAKIPKSMPTLLESNVKKDGELVDEKYDIPADEFRYSEGVPCPPRNFRLYDAGADTLLTEGTYDTGTSYKSHPVPIQGYDQKTLLFRADTDSVTDGLRIEVLTQEGNWRLYDAITASANSLESYVITGDFPLVRIGYEPSADGASITDAELTMR